MSWGVSGKRRRCCFKTCKLCRQLPTWYVPHRTPDAVRAPSHIADCGLQNSRLPPLSSRGPRTDCQHRGPGRLPRISARSALLGIRYFAWPCVFDQGFQLSTISASASTVPAGHLPTLRSSLPLVGIIGASDNSLTTGSSATRISPRSNQGTVPGKKLPTSLFAALYAGRFTNRWQPVEAASLVDHSRLQFKCIASVDNGQGNALKGVFGQFHLDLIFAITPSSLFFVPTFFQATSLACAQRVRQKPVDLGQTLPLCGPQLSRPTRCRATTIFSA